MKSLIKDLEEERAINASLVAELNKTREEKETLEATVKVLSTEKDVFSEGSVTEFERPEALSSTGRETINFGQESLVMSSFNRLAISSFVIPECTPSADDGEIHRNTFETWKNLLIDSMVLAGIDDEATKFTIFKVKAGARLLEIFKNTTSGNDAPDPGHSPFSNALHRLKTYFGSGSDIMLQRRKLAVMLQKPEESNLAFVTRVGTVARLCDFDEGKEFVEIVGAIAEHARDREVRTAALKMLGRKGSYAELVDKIREIEAIRINEEFIKLKNDSQTAAIASVSADIPTDGWNRSGTRGRYSQYEQTRDNGYSNRGRGYAYRGRGYQDRFHTDSRIKCWRCHSTFHGPADCAAINKKCRSCNRFGHLERACRSINHTSTSQSSTIRKRQSESADGWSGKAKLGKVASIAVVEDDVEEKPEIIIPEKEALQINPVLYAVQGDVDVAMDVGIVRTTVAGMDCTFMIDSGAQVNTLTEETFLLLKCDDKYKDGIYNLQWKSDRPLKAYASVGAIDVCATFEAFLYITDDRPTLLEKFYVVKEVRSLLGRPTATRYSVLLLGLKVPIQSGSWDAINDSCIASIEGNEVFPKFNIPAVKIYYDKMRPPCRNIFMNIPQAIKPLVQKRLEELVKTGIIEEITNDMDTSFCSSMLVVPKGKGDIRLVIDLRGPNKYIQRTPFTMPTLEKILAELNGANWFSTIDLCNAYFHIEIDKDSRLLTNFFTEFGMFRFIRLPFGLCNAPDIFQEVLQSKILQGCKGVKNYLDDILVYGKTKDEHDQNLQAVLSNLRKHNVKLNESKCVFGAQSVKFLGFILTSKGWKIESEKLRAVREFRRPSSSSELKSFLGLITFMDKFIVHRATKTENLRRLASADRFYWTEKEQKEFTFFQNEALKNIKNLGYFNRLDRTELYVDASPTGLGAVLVQINDANVERIIACASKSLTETERRYPQTQKEALAVVWGIERFSYYLSSISFTVRTDAEANVFIFDSNHRFGKRGVSRAESWALRLQAYDYTMQRVPGEKNIADALSRLIDETQRAVPFEEEDENHFLFALDPDCMQITWHQIESEGEADEELQKLRLAIKSDIWEQDLRRFEAHKQNIHQLGFLFFKEDKVILPKSLRYKVMKSAHGGHIGEVAMKRIMREHFWWPGMSAEVQSFVKNCNTCAMLGKKNPPLPIASRNLPKGPWEILQIDFLSVPKCGSGEFLVVVDTYSRYLSVTEMKRTDMDSTNHALCDIFKRWGCPLIIQSDNGPPFQSGLFSTFWEEKGVNVRKSIPLTPRSNGLVERQNQGIIKALSSALLEGTNWKDVLQLYVHRHNTLVPHSRLLVTPFELMVGWKYRGTFPSLWRENRALDRVEVKDRDAEAKLASKIYEDKRHGAKQSTLKVGDTVLISQQKKSKTDPKFSSERYRVVARDGPKVVIVNKNGIQYMRSVHDCKLAPQLDEEPDQETRESGGAMGQNDGKEIRSESTEISGGCGIGTKLPDAVMLRRRETIKKPARFDEKYIYSVFD